MTDMDDAARADRDTIDHLAEDVGVPREQFEEQAGMDDGPDGDIGTAIARRPPG